MSHNTLAQHYFLDALDLCHRFQAHWEDQPRKSSRVKSFVDLLMACECMLKAQCIVAREHLSLAEAYSEVKGFQHNIKELATAADLAFPSDVHGRACEYFGSFSVSLRYSVDVHEYFFPIGSPPKSGRKGYDETLGNSVWRNAAVATVNELLEWGKNRFNGEVTDNIADILRSAAEVETVISDRSRSSKRPK
ncbi:hypothetical protein [Hydrogenophaga sp. SL48]|uniref:hypothetical protein n=1 Tax=Hydrogenophaga sp. SL48 TaxID=2806347 RepID=UPI001F465665|nr:hypothetical protein [Hydrogenophaga sp. SL48]UJW82548.1 hypothetical protein IM738_07650 [Hydrogenophaga sp. SL48]